jgi:predicted metal-dependent peptidase
LEERHVTTDNANDPFAVLEEAARRQDAEEKLSRLIGQARTRLVLSRGGDAAFWATLALRLKVKAAWEKETLSTDGKTLFCNTAFVARLSDEERVGVIAHEVAHLALSHHTRMGSRDHTLWNVAGDLVANAILTAGGFTLPGCRLLPGEGQYHDIPAGLSTEDTYQRLMDKKKDKDDGKGGGDPQGKPQSDPGGCGQVQEPGDGTEAAKGESEAEWQVAVAQARNAAKASGQVRVGLDRFVEEVLRPVVDWRQVLREFVTRRAKSDYRMTPPNRRSVGDGLYLPTIRGEELGDVVLAVDTSGSIGAAMLKVFAGEIHGILDAYEAARLTILYHDSDVKHVQQWEASDGPIKLEPKGGGGTDHRPVFEWTAREGLDAACLLCLTDLASVFPDCGPDYPTLWASTARGASAPFGQLVEVVV